MDQAIFKETKEGVLLKILVKTGRPERKIDWEKSSGRFVISLKSRPTEGRANKELLTLLRKSLKRKVALVSGRRSKEKIILIEGATNAEVKKLLPIKDN